MSSALPAKRRRLNESFKSLSKPFVSPLKASSGESVPLKASNNAAKHPYSPSGLAHTVNATASNAPASNVTTSTHSTLANAIPANPTPVRKQISSTRGSKPNDPAEAAAQKALFALELQIRSIRNEMDILNQAAEIAASRTDADLKDLTEKWKVAAQTAADELFGSVEERVCQMGGVQAWRDSESNKYERNNGVDAFREEAVDDDADCEFDSQGDELPAEEQEYRKAKKRRARKEMQEALDVEDGTLQGSEDRNKTKQVENAEDEDTFTMAMMLRSLNIELDVIGYDKMAQRWVT